jgi:hypothetical protein
MVPRPRVGSLLAAAVMAAMVVTPSAAGANSSDPPKYVGMVTWDRTDLDVLRNAAGTGPAFFQVFASLESPFPGDWDYWDRLEADLARNRTSLAIEIQTNDLAALNAGKRDAAISQVIAAARHWVEGGSSRFLLVIPLPEANIGSHPWGGDPTAFRAAYQRVHTAFRKAGLGPATTRFMFAMNGPANKDPGYEPYYPGDDVVDIVGFSRLNRNDPWLGYEESFGRFVRQMQTQVTMTKPIMAYQTGSVTEGQDREAWLREMFQGLASEEQVIGLIYFNRAKTEAGKHNDYRVVNGTWVDPAFASGVSQWSATGSTAWIFDGRMDQWTAEREKRFPFKDIGTSPFQEEILWAAAQGITAGCTVDRFCPTSAVTRAQMATFLSRALGLPAAGSDWFSDDGGSVHEDSINRVASASITLGCGPGRYCPNGFVTRAQMASFLTRGLGLPAVKADYFTDDDGSVHEANIDAMAAAGVTLGCATGLYCPNSLVSREQMTAFLFRALGG